MKFKIIIFFIFLYSCLPLYNQNISYNSSGFALIFNEQDYINKKVNKKLNNDNFEVAHRNLKPGTTVKITNPTNKRSIVTKIKKRANFPSLYNLLISQAVADKLNIKNNDPFVELISIKKNKSFVAQEAKIFKEEKKIHSSAPVEKVKIDNISKKNKIDVPSKTTYSIVIGEFYSLKSVNELKVILAKNLNIDIRKFIINKTKMNVILKTGPYNSLDSIEIDYSKLKKYGFEELDILRNE